MEKKTKYSVYFQEHKIINNIAYYQILINDMTSKQTKVIQTRYSELREVYKQLSSQIREQLPFPSKNYICKNLKPVFLDYRQKALQSFINNLFKYCSEEEAKPFVDFLKNSPPIPSIEKLKNEQKATQIPSQDFQQPSQFEEIKFTDIIYNKQNSSQKQDLSKFKSEDDLSSILGNSQYQISNPSVFNAQPKLLTDKLNTIVIESNKQFVNINSNQDDIDDDEYKIRKQKFQQMLTKIKTLHQDSFMRSKYKFGMIYNGIDKTIVMQKSIANKNSKFIKLMDSSVEKILIKISNNQSQFIPDINVIQQHFQKQ